MARPSEEEFHAQLRAEGIAVHDTITEALRRYARDRSKWLPGYGDDPTAAEVWREVHDDAGESAHLILAALESAGFVVRKQVEPPALRQEWTWSWPNGSARGVPGYGYPVDSAEEALAEAGVHDRRNANVVTRFVSEWQQVEP